MDQSDNTIGARLASRVNNFDFLRLAAAFAVIFSHSYPIRDGSTIAEPYRRLSGYCSLGEVAVAVFFVISGMLVARSFIVDPSPGAFLKKRSLRIFPALIVCVAFCIFVVGPLFKELSFHDYIFNRDTLLFARNAIMWPGHYDLPGVFEQYRLGDGRCAVNGSLWTLPFEFILYIGVLILGTANLIRRKWCLIIVASALLFEWLVVERIGEKIGFHDGTWLCNHRTWFEALPQLGFMFFCGTLMLLFKDSIVLDWRLFTACLLIVAAGWKTSHGYFLQSVCLPYIVMYVAFARVPHLHSAAKWGDFSYGVYLYGYPVQQMLMRPAWGSRIPFPLFILMSCVGALLLAVLSWHLVEKQAMKWKKGSSRDGVPRHEESARDVNEVRSRPVAVVNRQFTWGRQIVFFV